MANESAQAAVQAREAETLTAWNAFTVGQRPYVKGFLLKQAREAATAEGMVTERYGDIATFRQDVEAVIDNVVQTADTYFGQIPESLVFSGWKAGEHRAELDTIARPFGVFMIKNGFNPAAASTHPGLYPEWRFYALDPITNHPIREGSGYPLDDTLLASYTHTLYPLASTRDSLQSALEQQASARVSAAWDS